jgi:hypothetical protein
MEWFAGAASIVEVLARMREGAQGLTTRCLRPLLGIKHPWRYFIYSCYRTFYVRKKPKTPQNYSPKLCCSGHMLAQRASAGKSDGIILVPKGRFKPT